MTGNGDTPARLPLDSVEALRSYTIDQLLPSVAAEATRLSARLLETATGNGETAPWPADMVQHIERLDEKVQLLRLLIRSIGSSPAA
jgi:hypothetical protein